MTASDLLLTINAQIHRLRAMRKEIDLMIRSLRSSLPDRDPQKGIRLRVINPDTRRVESISKGGKHEPN